MKKLVKIDPQLAIEIRNVLHQNSSLVYKVGETGYIDICLVKKKLTKSEEAERFQYEFSVIEKRSGKFVQEQTFSDKEIEYSRETAISFFLTTIFSSFDENETFALDKLICS